MSGRSEWSHEMHVNATSTTEDDSKGRGFDRGVYTIMALDAACSRQAWWWGYMADPAYSLSGAVSRHGCKHVYLSENSIIYL